MITTGDLAANQASLHAFQGAREAATSTYGNGRDVSFTFPIEGATSPAGQTENERAVVKTVVRVGFGVGYSDTPRMIADLSLADGEYWDDRYHPKINACVVSWRRLAAHEIYVGARVAIFVHDYPIGITDAPLLLMARLGFNGPAVASPIHEVDDDDVVDTTSGPDWDLPEE